MNYISVFSCVLDYFCLKNFYKIYSFVFAGESGESILCKRSEFLGEIYKLKCIQEHPDQTPAYPQVQAGKYESKCESFSFVPRFSLAYPYMYVYIPLGVCGYTLWGMQYTPPIIFIIHHIAGIMFSICPHAHMQASMRVTA